MGGSIGLAVMVGLHQERLHPPFDVIVEVHPRRPAFVGEEAQAVLPLRNLEDVRTVLAYRGDGISRQPSPILTSPLRDGDLASGAGRPRGTGCGYPRGIAAESAPLMARAVRALRTASQVDDHATAELAPPAAHARL